MLFPTNSLFFDIFFATLLSISIPFVGIAALDLIARRINFNRLEILAYGSGVGVVLYAAIGLVVGNLPSLHQPVAIALIVSVNIFAAFYWLKAQLLDKFKGHSAYGIRTAWVAWLFLSLVCIVFSHITIKFPDNLFDGPYVIKNHSLHVKVQTMTGHLPADNYLPYLVGEFFLRGISFKDERPLMPGQEIANRPILMALVSIPFRAALDPSPRQHGPLSKFQYVGSSWPDVGKLGEDRYFSQFLVVGIVLNALLILGATLLFNSFGLKNNYAIAGLILIIASPYFISQVIFTWPKALAAFYILIAIHALSIRGWVATAGLLTALAYNSHPYAIVFAGSFGLYLFLKSPKKLTFAQPAVFFLAAFAATVAPWFIWTKIILQIPSDLVTQNFFKGSSLTDSAWVRIYNLYETIFPRFLAIFPFNGDQILQNSLVCIPGIVGILFFIQAYAACKAYFSEHRFLILHGVLFPGILLIVVFGAPAVPALHGFQAIGPILVLLAMKWMQDNSNTKILLFLVATQLVINASMLSARGHTLGSFDKMQMTAESTVDVPQNNIFKTNNSISLLTNSSIETVNAPLPPHIDVPVQINGVEKRSIWMNPPASLIFRGLELGNSPMFHTFVAIHPGVWKENGADGAIFRVAVIFEGQEEVLLEKDINPFIDSSKKKWNEILIDMKRYENKRIDIVLSVSAGKANNEYADWCIWGEPAVMLDTVLNKK
jgi:hypothetical protein